MTIEERGFYWWLIHAMIEALGAEEEEEKRSIEFWSSQEPIGDPKIDERAEKSNKELVDLGLDAIHKIKAARGLLVSIEDKMPVHHWDEAYAAILKGLEQEVRDYRSRMARIIPQYEEIMEKGEKGGVALKLTLLAASDLEQALIKAREAAERLVENNQSSRKAKEGG